MNMVIYGIIYMNEYGYGQPYECILLTVLARSIIYEDIRSLQGPLYMKI
jgi:hypothetical protein